MCRISLTHIRAETDCVTSFFTRDFSRFPKPCSEVFGSCFFGHCAITSRGCRFGFCIQNYIRFWRSLVGCGGFSRCFPASKGRRTEVETRSAYRAHFRLDTNNFHSVRAALAAKESSYGLEYLMLFRVAFYSSSPEGSKNCDSDVLRDASVINSE